MKHYLAEQDPKEAEVIPRESAQPAAPEPPQLGQSVCAVKKIDYEQLYPLLPQTNKGFLDKEYFLEISVYMFFNHSYRYRDNNPTSETEQPKNKKIDEPAEDNRPVWKVGKSGRKPVDVLPSNNAS